MKKKILGYLNIFLLLIFFLILQIPIISYGENVSFKSPDEIDQQKMLENLPIGAHNGLSAHGEQWELFKDTRVKLEPEILEAKRLEELEKIKPVFPEAVTHTADPNFIVFGYHPSYRDGYESHYRWHAITHIGYCFVEFDSTAAIHTTSWDNRPDAFKAGGAAQANGVKVVLVLLSQDFNETHLNTVMQSASLRNTLINNVVAEVNSDSYCQGVSLDFELSWGIATRDGITLFCQGLNNSLKALTPPRELSLYVNPSYSSTRHNIPGLEPHLDYMLFSCYPWAGSWSSTVNAISDAYSFIRQANNYIDAGMPPNKVVLSISAYGYRWYTSSPTYGATIDSNIGSMGFITGMYDTTLEPEYGGPYTNNYERSDETGWYTFNDGATRVHVWDDDESLEYKLRLAKSWQDPDEVNNGTRLRGVAFWELGWLTKGTSYDPITDTLVIKTRTYGQLYQLCEEIFSPPGDINYLFEKFEGPDSQRDFRWRDPNESPDTTGAHTDSSRSVQTAPAGSGKPTNSDNAIQVYFDFENSSGNKIFFRHEILNDNIDTSITDKNSAKAYFDTTTKITAYMYVSGIGYSGRQVRMVVMDANRQLEMSNPYSLATPGWRLLEWDLTDLAQINAYTTSEPAFTNGNGVLNTAGSGAKDIAFIGFIIEGGGTGSGTVYFDELSYTHSNPDGKNYIINEFRYNGVANEFVEIYGPAEAIPLGFQLRVFDSTDGSATTFNISGAITDDGGGYGFFVVGDLEVPYVDFTPTGFSASDDNIPYTDPSAIQLYNSITGGVYDSVVYEAYGGLDNLIREQTLGVTQNGYPWLGEIASGTNVSGEPYTKGRYPDGNDTHINYNDFSFMPASPGLSNGNTVSVSLGPTYNFDATIPTKAFKTFEAFSVQNPIPSGIPESPNKGNVHRCVDTTGGGVISVIGDAALGYDGNGYFVSGEIYIPTSTDSAQAIAIGICGHQGSNFFSTSAEDSSSYESGYWLIFENKSGVGLNDGRDDHPDVFEFVYATNDNMDGEKVALLGSKSLALTGASAGAWTTFYFKIDPNAASGNRLIAQIKGVDIYRGNIPSGGPISGAFQIGFRENHAGNPASNEGTWIDNISIGPTEVSDWLLY